MPRHDRRQALARQWLAKARTDLALATIVLERDRAEMEGWAAAFHAQQAAEKALKAVLVARGTDPPHVHDLGALLALMPSDFRSSIAAQEVARLTPFATAARYAEGPEMSADPDWEEAEAAAAVAGRVLADVRAYLGIDG